MELRNQILNIEEINKQEEQKKKKIQIKNIKGRKSIIMQWTGQLIKRLNAKRK